MPGGPSTCISRCICVYTLCLVPCATLCSMPRPLWLQSTRPRLRADRRACGSTGDKNACILYACILCICVYTLCGSTGGAFLVPTGSRARVLDCGRASGSTRGRASRQNRRGFPELYSAFTQLYFTSLYLLLQGRCGEGARGSFPRRRTEADARGPQTRPAPQASVFLLLC
jgi:hypothetical protein